MGLKLFISYSHEDDSYRKEFEKYLIQLKRSDVIETWTDQEITLGDEWEKELIGKLKESDVIVFLVSQDFISSKYCFDVEMKTAMEMHLNKEAIVAPIIVRSCDWKNSEISTYQVCPTSAKPVDDWESKDKAWMDINTHIRELIDKNLDVLKSKKKEIIVSDNECIDSGDILNSDFRSWFSDTEIALTNPYVDRVVLQDVYVPPHLTYINKDVDDPTRIVDGDVLLDRGGDFLVLGDEQSGKTSLCKRVIEACLSDGIFPCFINAREIKDSDPSVLMQDKHLRNIYKDKGSKEFSDQNNKILIVDDLHEIGLNNKYRDIFIKRALGIFDKCIFSANDSFQFVANEINELDSVVMLEVQPFGYAKRSALIERWISIGREQNILEDELYARLDELKLQINSFVRGNVVPAKPLYILTVLQMLETFTHKEPEQTTSGYCYEYLIMMALEKAGVKASQLDGYLNILTEFSWFVYHKRKRKEKVIFSDFFEAYEKDFITKFSKTNVETTMVKSRLLRLDNEGISFRYPYIYYFFVAKRIAGQVSDVVEIKDEVSKLIDTLHREDSSNIIIFLSHHSRNPWVLEEIQLRLLDAFSQIKEATLSKSSMNFLAEIVSEIPELILETKDISKERLAKDHQADVLEKSNAAEVDKYLESDNLFIEINRVIRGIEIIGQILRTRHGSIHADVLTQMISIGTDAGLRFLQFFLELTDSAKPEVIRIIEQQLRDNVDIRVEEVKKEAENAFQLTVYSTISAIIRKISSSIGSKETSHIYKQLEKKDSTPALKLVNQAIELQFTKKVDIHNLKKINLEFKSNPVCERMLQEILIQHIYMYPLGFKEKQQVAEALGIPVAGQMKIQNSTNRLRK